MPITLVQETLYPVPTPTELTIEQRRTMLAEAKERAARTGSKRDARAAWLCERQLADAIWMAETGPR